MRNWSLTPPHLFAYMFRVGAHLLRITFSVSSRSPFPPQIGFLAALAPSRSHEAQFPLCDPWGFLRCLNPCHGGPIPSGSRLEAHLPPGSVVTGAQLPRCHTSRSKFLEFLIRSVDRYFMPRCVSMPHSERAKTYNVIRTETYNVLATKTYNVLADHVE